MFGFLTLLGKTETPDLLADAEVAEAFCRTLPQNDLLAAQKAICAALAEPNVRGGPEMSRLRALLVFDQRAWVLVHTLVDGYTSGNPQALAPGLHAWQAAFELCRSVGRAQGQFLKSMGDSPKFKGWDEYLPYLALRFFQYRQMELMLRPFVDERSTRFPWKEVHDAFRFAQSLGLTHNDLPVNRRHSASAMDTTLEREYIHVLLQDLMNGGHFSPLDALWVSEAIPRWSHGVVLKSRPDPLAERGFLVDLDGDTGIARVNGDTAETCLCLDTTLVRRAMRAEFEGLRDSPDRKGEGSWLAHGQRRRILAKLNVICANERPVIVRRGERKPTALTVEVTVGMASILGKLRSEAQDAVVTALRAAAVGEDVTITASGALAEPTGTYTASSGSAIDLAHPPLTMVDRSESGCRLHGPTLGSSPIVPGTLIAIREGAGSPWTLGVVRRVKKRLAGKRVEIGVEYLGTDPRRVIVVGSDAEAKPGATPPRFAALYLSGSVRYPALPMKTLVLPAREFVLDGHLSVRSRTDACTIQLKEPLDEQAEFIWAPFTIIEHQTAPPR